MPKVGVDTDRSAGADSERGEALHVAGVFAYGSNYGEGREHRPDEYCCPYQVIGYVIGTGQQVVIHNVEMPHPWPGGGLDD